MVREVLAFELGFDLTPVFDFALGFDLVRGTTSYLCGMHHIPLLSCCCILLCISACQQSEKPVNAPSDSLSTDLPQWAGTYEGTVPCADCEGIETRLTLYRAMTYRLVTRYLGKSDELVDKRGKFNIDATTSIATLEGIENGPSQYLLGKNKVTQLDMQGEMSPGSQTNQYQLMRLPGSELVGIRWSLKDLMGKEINSNPAYLMFDLDNRLIRGFGWCSPLRGSFEIESAGHITFGPVDGAAQVCADSILETQFLNLFEAADQYILEGRNLSLYRVRERPLAVFRQAELRQPQ